MKWVIEVRDVWKVYDLGRVKEVALRGVNLKVKEGEFLAIMGPSGSGKSTLMHIIGCLDRPSKGRVILFGRDVSKLKDNQLAEIRKRKIGFVFQLYYLFPNLTAFGNVELPMIFARVPKKERVKRVRELLKKVGLLDKSNHYPSELSGGQQQRVAIARALANDPEILLADEPTGALDTKSASMIMDLFKEVNNEGKTVIVVTHDPKVASYAERIAVIKDGKIIKEDASVDEAIELIRE